MPEVPGSTTVEFEIELLSSRKRLINRLVVERWVVESGDEGWGILHYKAVGEKSFNAGFTPCPRHDSIRSIAIGMALRIAAQYAHSDRSIKLVRRNGDFERSVDGLPRVRHHLISAEVLSRYVNNARKGHLSESDINAVIANLQAFKRFKAISAIKRAAGAPVREKIVPVLRMRAA